MMCAYPGCGKPATRPDAKYCSRQHYNADQRRQGVERMKQTPKRFCSATGCKKVIRRRKSESVASYEKRRFCSLSCSMRMINKERKEQKKAVLTATELPRRLYEDWPFIRPTSNAVRHAFKCSWEQAELMMRGAGLNPTTSGNPNGKCVNEFMRAEKLYAEYAQQGMKY